MGVAKKVRKTGKVLEITDQQIKYKEFDFQDGPTRNMNISEIFMITYENGKREVFNKPNETNDPSSKRQSVTNCTKKTAFGLDIGLGGSFYTIYNEKSTSSFAPALGIRVMHHFNPYFGVDFLKINWITDLFTSGLDDGWTMRLQIMPGIRGNTPTFFKCMSGYAAFRLGYGMDFRLLTVSGASHFESLCLETELGLNITPTVFAGFAYNYHKYFVNGNDFKLAMHTFSFRLGFNLGKPQETMKTEKATAELKREGVKVEIAKPEVEKTKVEKILDMLKYDGYSININKIVDLKQRESYTHMRYFAGGETYTIICFSDDTNVSEIGVHLERRDGSIANTFPTARGEIAEISFKPKVSTRRMNVVVTNLSSRTSNSASKFRIIIASK